MVVSPTISVLFVDNPVSCSRVTETTVVGCTTRPVWDYLSNRMTRCGAGLAVSRRTGFRSTFRTSSVTSATTKSPGTTTWAWSYAKSGSVKGSFVGVASALLLALTRRASTAGICRRPSKSERTSDESTLGHCWNESAASSLLASTGASCRVQLMSASSLKKKKKKKPRCPTPPTPPTAGFAWDNYPKVLTELGGDPALARSNSLIITFTTSIKCRPLT